MKKTRLLAGLLSTAILFILAGCGESPTEAVKNWQNAIVTGDADKANSLSTEKTHPLNQLIIASLKLERDNNGGPRIDDIKSSKFDKEEVMGDSAVVHYHTNKKSDQKINLIRINGKWYVDAQK